MKVKLDIKVRFRDIDSMNHVNNAVYLSYFEQARIHYFEELIGKEWNWVDDGILVARHEIDYKMPIELKDDVTIETWCESIGNSSVVMAYEVFKSGNILCTSGKTVLVCFSHRTMSKKEVPLEWREKMT